MASLAYGHLPPPPAPDRGAVRAHQLGQTSLALVGLGTVLVAGRAASVGLPPCPFRAITGVPCPGCGMTRLADAIVHGHVGLAAGADLAGVAILVVLVVLAATFTVRVVIQKGDPPRWMRSPILLFGIGALVLVHWVTTIVTGGLPSA